MRHLAAVLLGCLAGLALLVGAACAVNAKPAPPSMLFDGQQLTSTNGPATGWEVVSPSRHNGQ